MTSACKTIVLDHRGCLSIAGPDRIAFLNGLVSNDVAKVAPDRAVWSAFLTPQGKFLHEFAMASLGDSLVLDAEADRREDLKTRLSRFKLRSKVALAVDEGWSVAAAWGPGVHGLFGLPAEAGSATPFADGLAFTDPRLPEAGVRMILPAETTDTILAGLDAERAAFEEWDRHRIALGLPDGSRDMVLEKAILLENGFEELAGVDFKKGCFMGQELTARTKYRGLVKKRLIPVTIDGPVPPPGTPLTRDGKDAGEMRSGVDGLGLALVRLDSLRSPATPLQAGSATLTPRPPGWLPLGETA